MFLILSISDILYHDISDYPYKWIVLRMQPIGHIWIIFYSYSICLMCLKFIGSQNSASFHQCLNKQTTTTADYVHDKCINPKIRVYSTVFALHPCILSNYAHHFCCTLTTVRGSLTSKQSLLRVLGVTGGCFFICAQWRLWKEWTVIILHIVAESLLLSLWINLYCPSYGGRFNKQSITAFNRS
jgi:hypothetical protein